MQFCFFVHGERSFNSDISFKFDVVQILDDNTINKLENNLSAGIA